MHDPGVGSGAIGWVTTACMPAAAIMVPVTGLLHRSVRTHRLLLCALGLLLAGTVLGALAPDLVVVLVARIAQVLGTGMVVPIGMNLTLTVSTPERLGTTMGIVSAMTTLVTVLRPDRRRRDPPARRPAPALRPLRRARRGGLGRRPRLRRRRGRDHPSEAGRGLHRAHLAGPRRRPPRHLDDLHRPRARRRRPPAHRPGPPRPPSSCARAASPSR
ncbi:MAG: MFS transporter [Propionibacterium acidifaciens]